MRDGDFLVRGKEISRVEGLSDAVFGFAITLLVVSLEVPRTAAEVLHAMRGFFSFAITFTILFSVWRLQFGFFRRYGLEDNHTVGLTGVLLFVILFFIYPLKFVFGTFVDRLMMHAGWLDRSASQPITGHDFTLMYLAFSLGWTAVVSVFGLMYRHAYAMREKLQLTPIEVLDTKHMIRRNVLSAIPGFVLAGMNLATLLFPNANDAIAYPFIVLLLAFGAFAARTRRGMKAERLSALAVERHAVEA
jgi:uncharacterized membrane protein